MAVCFITGYISGVVSAAYSETDIDTLFYKAGSQIPIPFLKLGCSDSFCEMVYDELI